MNNGQLDVKNLLVVGFNFLQQYFLSVNEQSQKLIKTQTTNANNNNNKYGGYTGGYGVYGLNIYGGYGPMRPQQQTQKADNEKAKTPVFKVLKNPAELDKLQIVWNIALYCQNEEVVPKAIDFLIKVYYNLDGDLDGSRIDIQDSLITKCMEILQTQASLDP